MDGKPMDAAGEEKSPRRSKKSDGERSHPSTPKRIKSSDTNRNERLSRTPPGPSLAKKPIKLSPSHSGEVSTTSSDTTTGVSVTKTLAKLQSIPSNRSCAECRSPLLDSTQIFAAFTASLGKLPSAPHVVSAIGEFQFNHKAFAPPGESRQEEEPVDPALQVTQLLGYGVFVCAACGSAHTDFSEVHSLRDLSSWTPEKVDFLSKAGGNERSWEVFEKFMPGSWNKMRPNNKSTHAERQTFIRAKYDALLFLTPTGGPLSGPSWLHIVEGKPELERWAQADLRNFRRITLRDSPSSRHLTSHAHLPSRLVDFFCVVGHKSGRLAHGEIEKDLSLVSPQDLSLEVEVTDCYPPPDSYDDMDFPEQVSTFVFPDGCRPCEINATPSFFTFVFTLGNGQKLYGAAMHVYDDQMDTEIFHEVLEESGYEGALPWWLGEDDDVGLAPSTPIGLERPSEVVYIPKCLLVFSHYPFFDLWRKFLRTMYRITLEQAPLPIERYIANFVSEVPLPPLGKVEVQCGYLIDEPWSISRPAVNQLPLANFSYRPLFASLSASSIMVVCACLMQETSVALLSSNYALLGPVAESLLSFLFPFEWQGMYIPVMPYSMLQILEAPIPFVVGLHARYLDEVPRRRRPKGVVFVDLDKDEVHLGYDTESSNGNERNLPPRVIPDLPEKDAAKLKAKLEEYGETVYIPTKDGVKGRIFTGNGQFIRNSDRPLYAYTALSKTARSTPPRLSALSDTDKAFPDEAQLNPISGFVSQQGHMSDLAMRDDPKARKKSKNPFKKAKGSLSRYTIDGSTRSEAPTEATATCLLEMDEPAGFSSSEIRNAFLRFVVSIFNQYEKSAQKESSSKQEFLASLGLSSGSNEFVLKILGTQLYQRFLQERKDNPRSPSVLFFDESIIAKNNRSKRSTLATGGKQKTPFLDDTSGQICDRFTPPNPSNVGITDGQVYHYGSFPALREDLFGKVSAPKKWHQQEVGTYRTVASAAALKQQELINKAIGSETTVPTLVTSNRSLVGRDIEWAVRVLSNDGSDHKSRSKIQSNVGSRTSAQEQVLAARRKQAILIEIIIKLQTYCRMFIARRRYNEFVGGQRRSSRTLQSNAQDELRLKVSCATGLQKLARQHSARNRYKILRKSAVTVQSAMRGFMATRQLERLKAAIVLQSWIRGVLLRRYMMRLRQAAVQVQAVVRGRNSRFAHSLLLSDIAKAQALLRGYLTRKIIRALIKKRVDRYRQQIFMLWKRAHTPLAYRTKMWPLLDGTSFKSVTLAEDQLQRFWGELEIKLPAVQTGSSLKHDDHFTQAECMGLVNHLYLRYTSVQAAIESLKKSKGDGNSPWFRGEGSPHLKKAADREVLERLQIYERLQDENNKASLDGIYNYFEITSAEKMKKRHVADCIWLDPQFGSRSVTVMVALFPELQYGTSMNYKSPSKKGQKRFHVSGARVPEPLDHSMRVETIESNLIQSNMKEFANAYAGRVPELMMRLKESERKKSKQFLRRCDAAMYARNMVNNWPRCRYRIILQFLYPK